MREKILAVLPPKGEKPLSLKEIKQRAGVRFTTHIATLMQSLTHDKLIVATWIGHKRTVVDWGWLPAQPGYTLA